MESSVRSFSRSGGISCQWISDPDVRLMIRVRHGDQAAFRALFNKHRRGLMRFAYRFVRDQARAEELVQDAFLQVYRARSRYEPRARFGTYLYRIMTNLCLNERRQLDARARTSSLEDAGQVNHEDSAKQCGFVETAPPSPDDYVAGVEMASRLRTVLENMYPNQSAALAMSRVHGLSYREVADSLDTSVSAVKSLVFRATQTLRREMQDWRAGAESA